MPRKKLIKTANFPYQITNRSNNKEFFYVDLDVLWEIFLDVFHELEAQFGIRIHLFVLMSNHYHLVISTPKLNIGEAMKYLHREVARRANKNAGRINHFFGGRYKWCLIDNENYFWNAIKYNFRNPVEARICYQVEDYKYSSLNTNSEKVNWQLVDFFNSPQTKIKLDSHWLNQSFSKQQREAISKGLRRRMFQVVATNNKKLVDLETPQYEKGTVT